MCAIIRAIDRPWSGMVPAASYWPSRKPGSRVMASRATALNAMFCADRRDEAAITTAWRRSSGCVSAHSSTCMPPSEPPKAASSRWMPRWWIIARWTVTKSPMSRSGKSSPYAWPVAGSMLDGPVVPWQPPRRLAQITYRRSVSSGRPGPIMLSHQPGRVSPAW